MSSREEKKIDLGSHAGASQTGVQHVPLIARLTHEIPKPKDWQSFQRNSVFLFQGMLGDPNAQEYGRNGQNQNGIDILGRRGGTGDRWVGIQCKKINRPLTQAQILKECRATLRLRADLKEIIFATTAPNDTKATDAAIEVEKILEGEGRKLSVTVYGWENLCNQIAAHDRAYAAFYPAAMATQTRQVETLETGGALIGAMQALTEKLAAAQGGLASPVEASIAQAGDGEDKALHARIDVFRDLFKNDKQPGLAETGLKSLIGTFDPIAESRADFRIKFNLGSIALECGREAEAISYYEEAHAVRPSDPTAVANVALARTLQGRFDEAMALARDALAGDPPADHAIGYLLQAAARSTWNGEPESLIPEHLAGTPDADVGLAEFLRLRETPGWEGRVIELGKKHPETLIFRRLTALAILALAAHKNAYLPGGTTAVDTDDLSAAADEMKENAEYYLRIGYSGKDFLPTISNAAVILRYCNRLEEAEDLLMRATSVGVSDAPLIRVLGLIQALRGKRDRALKTLEALTDDGEARLLSVELLSESDPREALERALAVPDELLSTAHQVIRWSVVAETSITIDDDATFERAISKLTEIGAPPVTVDLLRLRRDGVRGVMEAELEKQARAIAASVPADLDMPQRVMVAQELRNYDRPLEASRILEGYVDLRRMSPGTLLYLQALAGARRDDAFQSALQKAAPEVRKSPDVLWLMAAHSWNVGDLPAALEAVQTLLRSMPENFRARLLHIEILARQNNSIAIAEELSKPVEDLKDAPIEARLRIVALLGHFGFTARATAFAYRLFMTYRDDSRVWMALSQRILQPGQGGRSEQWEVRTATLDAAVDVKFEDGDTQFFVIESDPELLKVDIEAREPTHPLSLATLGKATGQEFMIEGRKGQIVQLRHKFVARFQYVLQHYESRFPEIVGFRSVKCDPSQPDGLDDVRAQLIARSDWVKEQSSLYESSNWPIAILAINTGNNVIEAASGIASLGKKLKVAAGNDTERQVATLAISQNARRGCVLDLWTFWTARNLGALDVIEALCGRIVLAQNSLDELRNYRARIADFLSDGLKTMSFDEGKILLTETSPEAVAASVADIDQAILWIEGRGANQAVVATDKLPDQLLEHLQSDASHIFDEVVLAIHSDLILVSDDMALRQMAVGLGVKGATWLHCIAGRALTRNLIDVRGYVRWSTGLIDAGQYYLGISGEVLAASLEFDVDAGSQKPGREFTTLSSVIGGRNADPGSHILAVLKCLHIMWSDFRYINIRQAATGLLVRQLLQERTSDYSQIFKSLFGVISDPYLRSYLIGWSKGHFVSDALI